MLTALRKHLKAIVTNLIAVGGILVLALGSPASNESAPVRPDEQMQRILDEKARIEARDRAERERGQRDAAPTDDWYIDEMRRDLERRILEADESAPADCTSTIDEHAEGPWPANYFRTENGWGGCIDGTPMSVYAGASPDDPEQGKLLTFTSRGPDDRTLGQFEQFPAPASTGALRILREDAGILFIESANGAAYRFDLGLRMYR